jgi:hypothetical protein
MSSLQQRATVWRRWRWRGGRCGRRSVVAPMSHHRSIDYSVVFVHPLDSWVATSSSSPSPPSMRGGAAAARASAAEQQQVQGRRQRSNGWACVVAAKWRMACSLLSIGVGVISFFFQGTRRCGPTVKVERREYREWTVDPPVGTQGQTV